MIQHARTRLDDLLQLRAEIETEIVRERKAMKRAKELRIEMIRLGSRTTWSQRVFAAACARYGVEVDIQGFGVAQKGIAFARVKQDACAVGSGRVCMA